MIYLIESENGNVTYYKIGYTNDDNFERRMDLYKLHNPFCKVLYTISGATENQERLIHAKFNEYLVYRREWFKNSVKILRFFDRHRTKESLDNEFKLLDLSYFIKGSDGKLTDKYLKLRKEVKKLINVYCTKRLKENNSREIAKEYDTLMNKYLPMLGKTIFSIEMFKECFSEGDLVNIDTGTIGNTEKDFIKKFNTLPGFYDKMKVLCEAGLNAEEINVVLDQIPLTYKKYYIGIGPERCRAKGYSLTGIKKEYDNLFVNESSIVNDIYNYFQEGSTYTKKEIKEKLSEIYSKQGLNKNPKATDLEEYFEVKASKIVKKGISSHCFKLIKRK